MSLPHRRSKEVVLLKMAVKALEENINAMSAVEVRKAQKMAVDTIFAIRERLKVIEWDSYNS